MHLLSVILWTTLALAPSYQQDSAFDGGKKSILTADEQVEFPGVVLEPGVYVVKLREAGDRRSSVQIFNEDETQLLASVVAVPDLRSRPDINTEFTFHEIHGNRAHPVQSWFYPGELAGLEFVYPKSRARELARNSDGHVMALSDEKGTTILAITPNGKEVVIDGQPTLTARRKPQ